ncbi:hypothetical protein CASFOL_017834 [Castilleja foliolosa]|uniref:Uncharacterized protein n=1 Tax=Castilleja foliolosa TaxID=1961234 RepID=A0ABD3D8M3_9LAMI
MEQLILTGRAASSLPVMYSLVNAHLKELELDDVADELCRKIPAIVLEKSVHSDLVVFTVSKFFGTYGKATLEADFVRSFHRFIEAFLSYHDVPFSLRFEFGATVAGIDDLGSMMHDTAFKSIEKLRLFMRGVEYTPL